MKKIIFEEANKKFSENRIEEFLKIFINTNKFKNLYLWLFNKYKYGGDNKFLNVRNLSKQEIIKLRKKIDKIFPIIKANSKYRKYFILNDLAGALEIYNSLKTQKFNMFRNYVEIINFYISIWGENNIKTILNKNNKLQKIFKDLEDKEYFKDKINYDEYIMDEYNVF